jgi:hypothetical protein
MSNNNKKDGDVEMKDSTVNGTADKKEEVKKEEPYDPFFGKAQSIDLRVFRVQEGDGAA